MSDSVFRVRHDSAATSGASVSEILNDPVYETDIEEETAKLLVIPISQEIAPDFRLIGYDDTIRRIEEVLTQRGLQRNVLLYGEQGVGKTAIIHGLVQRKNHNDLSTHMFKRKLHRLNCSLLLHSDDVAEINKQFDQVLQEFGRYDVLVIENVYTLLTYLRLKGANVVLVGLLEALSRRRLQAIITCNTREKALIINEVPEIHEFFSPERLNEPNDADLLAILRGVRRSYEQRYSISITDNALRTIRNLTQKYRNGLEGWAQPGRALILQDRSIAQFSVRMNSKPPELCALENEAAAAQNEIDALTPSNGETVNQIDLDRRQQLTERLATIKPQIDTLRTQWDCTTAPIREKQTEKSTFEHKQHQYITQRRRYQDMRSDNAALAAQNTDATTVAAEIARLNKMALLASGEIKRIDDELASINLSAMRDHVVTEDHIAQTFSELSGISTKQLTENERERVLQMESILGDRVYGQPEALKAVATAVRRARAGLGDVEGATEAPPRGSFLFLGPSGCGKTETGKALAEFEASKLIRFDMSEYMERHAVSRLIGAPPGYAGHDEGGLLTKAVHDNPKAVVMFDEIEKAHEDIFKIFLQVLSDGRLTDGMGETVDFRETIIIMTSNAGTEHFLDESLTYEEAAQLAKKAVERFLLTEIRGRIDDIICFRRLDLSLLEKVAQRRIDQLGRSLKSREATLDISAEDRNAFCACYQNPSYGARSILTAMKRTLEADLSFAVLSQPTVIPGVYQAGLVQDRFEVHFAANA